jgi:hypothetical protein
LVASLGVVELVACWLLAMDIAIAVRVDCGLTAV